MLLIIIMHKKYICYAYILSINIYNQLNNGKDMILNAVGIYDTCPLGGHNTAKFDE